MKSASALAAVLVAAIGSNPSEAWVSGPRPGVSVGRSVDLRVPAKLGPVHKSAPARVGAPAPLKMSLASNAMLTSVAPKLGLATSTFFLLSPFKAVKRASEDDAIGDLNPAPLATMVISTLWWVAYGLTIRNPYVIWSNLPGCIFATWYITSVLPLLKGKQLRQTRRFLVSLTGLTLSAWAFLSLTNKPAEGVSSTLGLMANLVGVIQFGAPLSTIKTVIDEGDSASILAPLTFAQITNAALWVGYGLAIGNLYIVAPNIPGVFFGGIMLALKLIFPHK